MSRILKLFLYFRKKWRYEYNYDILNSMWAESDRPGRLQDPDVVNNIPMRDLMALMSGNIELAQLGDAAPSMQGVTRDETVVAKEYKDVEWDDCRARLHSARWQRLPLTPPSDWWHKTPVKMSPVIINALQLDVTGAEDQVLPETIKLMHDRRNILELKLFFIGSFDSAKGKNGRQLEYGTSMLQIQEAICNYQDILQQLFPWDATANSMWRLLVTYKWIAAARSFDVRRDVIIVFFHAVSRKNATRAGNGQPPIPYAKQEGLLKKTLRKYKVREDIPTGEDAFEPKEASQPSNKKQAGGSGGNNSHSGGNNGKKGGQANKAAQPKKVRAHKDGRLVCIEYNNKDVCPNEADGPGCKKDVDGVTRYFVHCCNVYDKAKKAHCLGPHNRANHNK